MLTEGQIQCMKEDMTASLAQILIEERGYSMEQGGIRAWMLNTFAVNNLINESHHLKHQILFEKIPSGQRFLTPIIEAMRDKVQLMMTYQSFHKDYPSTFMVKPYCVKVYRQRWYMLGKSDLPHLITYSLDRIVELEPTDKHYKLPANFDAEAYFAAYEIKYPNFEFQCTCRKSRQIWKEGHHNLDIIAGYCGYDLTNHHHALADAEACAVIGIKIL